MKLQTIADIPSLKNKTVLLRVDWNIKDEQFDALKDTRILYTFETIKYLQEQNAKVVIITHLGRPKGKKNTNYSLKPLVTAINEQFLVNFNFIESSLEDHINEIKGKIETADISSVHVLENIRFYQKELDNDDSFAKKLAELGDIYIDDAFANMHRIQVSMHAITKYLPSYAGFLVEKEIQELQKGLDPKGPSVAIFGGVKIDTKLGVIEQLAKKYDKILLGTVLSKIFYLVQGISFGVLDVEVDPLFVEKASKIWSTYSAKLILLSDAMVAKKIDMHSKAIYRKLNEIEHDDIILDIGDETIKNYSKYIDNAQTILWNGPLGFFEIPVFKDGTLKIAQKISQQDDAYTLAGGGETLTALKQAHIEDSFSFVSTGGGAMLEYLQKQSLPSLEVLYK